jgi:hypothetical protein
VNNLQDAIVNLYLAGDEANARKYYEYLAVNYKNMFTGKTQEEYLQDLDSFVWSQFADMADRFGTVRSVIHEVLSRGYVLLASGYVERYAESVNLASQVYQRYQKERMGEAQGRQALAQAYMRIISALRHSFLRKIFPEV